MPEPPTIEELQEFIDGRLEGKRLQEVHAYLAQDEETARLVQRMRQTDADLRRLGYEMVAGERAGRPRKPRSAPPAGRADGLMAPGASESRGVPVVRRYSAMAVSACLLIAIAAGGGWWAGMSYEEPSEPIVNVFLGEVTDTYDYVASGDPQRLDFLADQRDQWAEWSSRAYGRLIEPPDLQEYGYEFVGARIGLSGTRTSSVFAYRGEDDTTISIYCWKQDESLAGLPRQAITNGYRINMASGTGYGFAVIGPDDLESLDQATRSVASDFRKVFGET